VRRALTTVRCILTNLSILSKNSHVLQLSTSENNHNFETSDTVDYEQLLQPTLERWSSICEPDVQTATFMPKFIGVACVSTIPTFAIWPETDSTETNLNSLSSDGIQHTGDQIVQSFQSLHSISPHKACCARNTNIDIGCQMYLVKNAARMVTPSL
jgi:hypothetical protein